MTGGWEKFLEAERRSGRSWYSVLPKDILQYVLLNYLREPIGRIKWEPPIQEQQRWMAPQDQAGLYGETGNLITVGKQLTLREELTLPLSGTFILQNYQGNYGVLGADFQTYTEVTEEGKIVAQTLLANKTARFCFDRAGCIYGINPISSISGKYQRGGTFLHKFGYHCHPIDIRLDPSSDTILISNSYLNVIDRYQLDGTKLSTMSNFPAYMHHCLFACDLNGLIVMYDRFAGHLRGFDPSSPRECRFELAQLPKATEFQITHQGQFFFFEYITQQASLYGVPSLTSSRAELQVLNPAEERRE